jgi:hypothetical protein
MWLSQVHECITVAMFIIRVLISMIVLSVFENEAQILTLKCIKYQENKF